MSIRALDLLDLPTLHRYRNEVLGFDTARSLTKGSPLSGLGLVSHLASPSRNSYSAIADGDGGRLMGGVYRIHGESFAKLLYLAPASRLDHRELPALLENLADEVGNWGAFHVVAEVEETGEAFQSLRHAGYSVYAWQRMCDVSEIKPEASAGAWDRAAPADLSGIQSLYQQIVPPLIQPVEHMPGVHGGYVCNEGVRCYARYVSGAYGIALSPLIHPEARNVDARIMGLINSLTNRRNRPRIHLCPLLPGVAGKRADRPGGLGGPEAGADGEAPGAPGEG